jgi:hypothetical protein
MRIFRGEVWIYIYVSSGNMTFSRRVKYTPDAQIARFRKFSKLTLKFSPWKEKGRCFYQDQAAGEEKRSC